MWAQERHRRIQGLLGHHKQVSADELARQLDVSRETIRRDLVELEAAGLLRRVHGGAILPDSTGKEAPFADRLQVRRREKQAIARAAAQLVEPGQTCFVDAGSTTVGFDLLVCLPYRALRYAIRFRRGHAAHPRRLATFVGRITPPLRSTPITEASSLLREAPPLIPASVFFLMVLAICHFPLHLE